MNLAIAGLGWWGQRLIEAAQRSTKVQFLSGTSANPAGRKDVAANYGLRLCDSLPEMLNDRQVDGVVIATPHSVHLEQVEMIAEAGKHVFCEKPLAMSRADAQRAIEACKRVGVVLAVGQNRRFAPNIQGLEALVQSGSLGSILHAEANWSNDNTSRRDFGAWRHSSSEAPASALTGTGIHVLDVLVALFGRPRVVNTLLRRFDAEERPPIDALTAVLEFDKGVLGLLATVRPTPRYWRVHVFGSEGSAEARGDDELCIYRSGLPAEIQVLGAADTLRLELEAFADAAAGVRVYPVTATQVLDTMEAFEAILRQISHGSQSLATVAPGAA